jgi:hypothetical protein
MEEPEWPWSFGKARDGERKDPMIHRVEVFSESRESPKLKPLGLDWDDQVGALPF